jgi:hypothetical protein
MKAWRVDERINNVKNNDPTLSDPLEGKGDDQREMFGER